MLGRTVRAGTALTASAAGVLGVVYGVFQVLQSSLGDFHPRVAVQLLTAATVFIFGLALSRVRALAARRQARNERNAQLDADLAIWPLETLDRVDAYDLGVFPVPARNSTDRSLGGYVKRDLDDEIADAIESEPFVLIFGPPRGGKTRTAYEAAKRKLGHAWVIVPEGPEELRTLLTVEPPLDFGSHTAVIWLDALDRFIDWLDLDLMDAVGGDQRLKIVATIRRDKYEEMLRDGGQAGETGRRILTRARGILLPDTLSPTEEAAADGVIAGRSAGSPLGADVAELLNDGHHPAERPRGASSVMVMAATPPTPSPPWWRRRIPNWLPNALLDDLDRISEQQQAARRVKKEQKDRRAELKKRGVPEGTDVNPRRVRFDTLLAAALFAFGVVLAWLVIAAIHRFEDQPSPSLDEQLASARHALNTPTSNWRATSRTVRFHGEEELPSFLITYRPMGPTDQREERRSSEIRVYDQSKKGLRLKLRFRPDPELGGHGTNVGWRFFIRNRTVDINDSGGADVAGAFRPADDRQGRLLPVVIYDVGDGYAVKGLGRTLRGGATGPPGSVRVDLRETNPPVFKPPLPQLPPVRIGPAYTVADFMVANLSDAPKFIVGEFQGQPRSFFPNDVVVRAWRLGARDRQPYLGVPCRVVESDGAGIPPGGAITFRSPADSLWPNILAAWKRVDRRASCRSAGS